MKAYFVLLLFFFCVLGCDKGNRVFDSTISAIRDQTKVLEKIEKHLEKIAEREEK